MVGQFRLAIVVVIAMVSYGCMLNPQIFGYDESAQPLAENQFWFELDPDRAKEGAVASNPVLRMHIEQELSKKGLCKEGYTLLAEGYGRGYYYVKGRCR